MHHACSRGDQGGYGGYSAASSTTAASMIKGDFFGTYEYFYTGLKGLV